MREPAGAGPTVQEIQQILGNEPGLRVLGGKTTMGQMLGHAQPPGCRRIGTVKRVHGLGHRDSLSFQPGHPLKRRRRVHYQALLKSRQHTLITQ